MQTYDLGYPDLLGFAALLVSSSESPASMRRRANRAAAPRLGGDYNCPFAMDRPALHDAGCWVCSEAKRGHLAGHHARRFQDETRLMRVATCLRP